MKILPILLLLTLAACQKESACDGDGMGQVEVFNSHTFAVKVSVLTPNGSGGYSGGGDNIFSVVAGGTWKKDLAVGQYMFKVDGDDGNAPYASYSVHYAKADAVEDCGVLRIEP